MPLHGGHVGALGAAYGLHGAVQRAAGLHHEAGRQVLHALVMDAVGTGLGDARVELRQPGARDDLDGVIVLLVARQRAVVEGAGALGDDVLPQRAAVQHVDELEATADAEHRLARVLEGADQFHLVGVAHRVARPGGVQRLFAIGRGRDVVAALQHQAVQRLGVVVQVQVGALDDAVARDGRHHDRHGVTRQHPVRHRLLQEVQRLGEDARQRLVLGGVVDAGGDADQQGFGVHRGLLTSRRGTAARSRLPWRGAGWCRR